jgi:hypothetical protein
MDEREPTTLTDAEIRTEPIAPVGMLDDGDDTDTTDADSDDMDTDDQDADADDL